MKYKVGESHFIRDDLINGKYYGDNVVVDEMLNFTGKEVIIALVGESFCLIEEDDNMWSWTYEMFKN